MRPIIYLFILSSTCFHAATAQSLSPTILSAAGDVNSTDHLQLEWTLGELAVASVTRQQNSYTEGFHQPLLIITPVSSSRVNDAKEQATWNANVTITPNPVATTLLIQFENVPLNEFQITLTNQQGQVIDHQSLLAGESQKEFNLSALTPGMYYLQIQSADGQTRHVYKISKIQ
jgi:hypothetical protein